MKRAAVDSARIIDGTIRDEDVGVGLREAHKVVSDKAPADYLTDGVNDEVEINAALQALTSGRTWIETVVLLGDFLISDTIKLPSYTRLIINGRIRLADNSNVNMIENSDPTGGDVHIEIMGGELDGNKANQTAGHGIYMENADYVRIFRAHIHHCYEEGIYLYNGCDHGVILACKLHDNRRNILFGGTAAAECMRNRVSFCHLYNPGHRNIEIFRADESYITHNRIDGSAAGYDTVVGQYSGRSKIAYNMIANSARHGIHLANCTESKIIGNDVLDSGSLGIYAPGDFDRGVIMGNLVRNCQRDGISLNNVGGRSTKIVIIGNIVLDASLIGAGVNSGIKLAGDGTSPAERIVIANNVIDGENHKYAIEETGIYDYTLVIGNNIGAYATGAVSLVGANSRAIQNSGYNPVGYISPDPTWGASPWTYTNEDRVPEEIYIFVATAGDVTSITKDGQDLPLPGTEPTYICHLEPGESIVITYTTAGTLKRFGW